MYPFFYLWFKGKNINTYMDFKTLAYHMSDQEYDNAYKQLDCLAKNRLTDSNELSIAHAIKMADPSAQNICDIGCGLGYFISRIHSDLPHLKICGCDVFPDSPLKVGTYYQGDINKLPFPDKEFDIVTCFHTLEHIRDLDGAISELKRVCKKQIIIVVPVQKYYYYTLDLHLNFFPLKEMLLNRVGIKDAKCARFGYDFILIANI